MYGVEAGHPLLFPKVQLALHPSPSTVFPSSHYSVPAKNPSPHIKLGVQVFVRVSQL